MLLGKAKVPDSDAELDATTNQKELELRDLNNLAFSDLILSMDTSRSSGKVAFNVVQAATTEALKDGDAELAYKNLKRKYSPTTTATLTKLTRKFYTSQMSSGVDPDTFITMLSSLRL